MNILIAIYLMFGLGMAMGLFRRGMKITETVPLFARLALNGFVCILFGLLWPVVLGWAIVRDVEG